MKRGDVKNVNFPIKYTLQTPFKECVPARAIAKPLYVETEGEYEFKYAMTAIETDEITDFKCLENGWACHSTINIY